MMATDGTNVTISKNGVAALPEAGRGMQPLRWFLPIAFGLAWPLFMLPIAFGPPGVPARQAGTTIAWAAAMWAPGIAALVATRVGAHEPLSTLRLGRLGPGSV
jgi:hypothetical protein